jgi:5,6-dimethylbenzimidazole synthase
VRNTVDEFSVEEKRGLYRAIYERRDVRSQFLRDPLPAPVLGRILDAAHHAPSVGFMQPWDFIVIEDATVRAAVHANFTDANRSAAALYTGPRREIYDSLKLQGILDAPVNLCVTCDPERSCGHRLGRQTDPATVLYSAACAVQNLWLAARAESVGVGWVSILDLEALKSLLGIPAGHTVTAYLCLGFVSEFRPKPDLEEHGWERRQPLPSLLHFDGWGRHDDSRAASLFPAATAVSAE